MSRIIILALIVWVIYVIFKRMTSTAKKPPQNDPVEDIVQCAYCGVYSPKRESYLIGQQYFCCIEHSKANSKESSLQ